MRKLVIFDLDGTLLNTIADLAQSTNHALAVLGYPTHEEQEYNFMVGNGINKLFERALPATERTEENIMRVRKGFIPYYDQHNADKSRPYPGIPELLAELQAKGLQLAVASNKYQAATEKLIAHYFPQHPFHRRLRATGRSERETRSDRRTRHLEDCAHCQRRCPLRWRFRCRHADCCQCQNNRLRRHLGISPTYGVGNVPSRTHCRQSRRNSNDSTRIEIIRRSYHSSAVSVKN